MRLLKMNEFKRVQKFNIQKKLDKLSKKYRNKKVILYGAGKFAQYLLSNYDFSKLNIIAVVDKKFENNKEELFHNYPCFSPKCIQELHPDLILILNINYIEIAKDIYNLGLNNSKQIKIAGILETNLLEYLQCKIKYRNPQIKPEEKYIFTFWEPKNKIPPYIKLCMNTWKKFLPEYKIILLDYTNLDEWLGFEYFDNYLYKNFSLPKQADAIRVAILNKHGGIWLDADTILTSENIRNIFNQNADCTIIDLHLACIIANKNSKFLKCWLRAIKRNLILHKYLCCFNNFLSHIISVNTIAMLDNWSIFGNSIINNLYQNFKSKEFISLSGNELFALPENNFFKNSIEKYNNYLNFYFKNDYSDYVLQNTKGIILLHNSWTPKEYQNISETEFLEQNNTLSRILLKIGEMQ